MTVVLVGLIVLWAATFIACGLWVGWTVWRETRKDRAADSYPLWQRARRW